MLRIGLTGGLGSGKSTVAAMFMELGASVIAADEIGRDLMQPGQPVYAAIVREFGNCVVSADGSLDRKALAALAFQHRRWKDLSRIVHPAVVAQEEEWMRGIFAARPNAVAIVESALIFEAEQWGTVPGWIDRFDSVILVTVPDEVKIARFVERMMGNSKDEAARAGWTQDAQARLASQIPDREKIAHSGYVIENTGPLEVTRAAVTKIYRELERKARCHLP